MCCDCRVQEFFNHKMSTEDYRDQVVLSLQELQELLVSFLSRGPHTVQSRLKLIAHLCEPPICLSASHAARCVACQGVGSQPVLPMMDRVIR